MEACFVRSCGFSARLSQDCRKNQRTVANVRRKPGILVARLTLTVHNSSSPAEPK
jgi:hypothetical protein